MRAWLLSCVVLASIAAPIAAPVMVSARVAEATQVPPLGKATRQAGMVSLVWSGLAGPVKVYVSDTPDGKAVGQPTATVFKGDAVALPVSASQRPYFLLRDERGRELRLAERVLPLEGGNNFRDLGGYVASDGRTVRWGKLFRSATMNGLTADDFRLLGKMGISTVCDFRDTGEREASPVAWPQGVQPRVLTRDYALDLGPMMGVFAQPGVTGEQARQAMAGFGRDMPFMFKAQFSEMFRELVAGRAPLAFNCSAGKDRTGMAAVLVLSALGVPRETAIADYLLSNQYYKPRMPAAGAKLDPTTAFLAKLPPEVLGALMGVDRRYMEASLAAIDEKGGMDRYLREDMGLSDVDRSRLKALYLTPA